MRPSGKQKRKYENRPAAKRGIPLAYVKLLRSGLKYVTQMEEMDVELRKFDQNDYRVRINDQLLNNEIHKDAGHARRIMNEYVERMVSQGWVKMNQREHKEG